MGLAGNSSLGGRDILPYHSVATIKEGRVFMSEICLGGKQVVNHWCGEKLSQEANLLV